MCNQSFFEKLKLLFRKARLENWLWVKAAVRCINQRHRKGRFSRAMAIPIQH